MKLQDSRHIVVTRFSIPWTGGSRAAGCHASAEWLSRRLELFRRFYVPSVGRLGVPALLLCSSRNACYVAGELKDLSWVHVVVQDEGRAGWTGRPDQVLTRLDSDDALHEGWFDAVDGAPAEAEVICTRRFLRLDLRTGAAYRYRRRKPSPLAAFRKGADPYARDHEALVSHYRTAELRGAYLLQVAHGGNLSNRFPKPFRRRRARSEDLRGFGLLPAPLSA